MVSFENKEDSPKADSKYDPQQIAYWWSLTPGSASWQDENPNGLSTWNVRVCKIAEK